MAREKRRTLKRARKSATDVLDEVGKARNDASGPLRAHFRSRPGAGARSLCYTLEGSHENTIGGVKTQIPNDMLLTTRCLATVCSLIIGVIVASLLVAQSGKAAGQRHLPGCHGKYSRKSPSPEELEAILKNQESLCGAELVGKSQGQTFGLCGSEEY